MLSATFSRPQCFKSRPASRPSERYHALYLSRCKSRPKVVRVELGQAAMPSSPYARDRFVKRALVARMPVGARPSPDLVLITQLDNDLKRSQHSICTLMNTIICVSCIWIWFSLCLWMSWPRRCQAIHRLRSDHLTEYCLSRFQHAQIHWTRQIWGIWKLRPAYSPETPNSGQKRWCFVPCDLEIWWMTLENNRAPLLCCFKLCATFHNHQWIQTGVAVQKRPISVKFDDF